MKIAVIKLGARITWDTDGAVAPGEAVSICKALLRGGAVVHVFTKILKKDTLDASIAWHNISDSDQADLEGLDVLLVINGNVNFFGGAEDREQIMNYAIINNFPGKVVYVMCDPELPLMQIWDNVSKKEWGIGYREQDVLVTRTDIHVLSQPHALGAMKKYWPKKAVQPGSFFHFPMDRFPFLNEWIAPLEQPKIDLMYGGTHRGGRRIPNLFKWYWNLPDDISVEIFGNIDAMDFLTHKQLAKRLCGNRAGVHASKDKPPAFTGKVKYDQVLPKMNSALAHLVTGDPSYEILDIIPQRTAECIAAGNVVFIDSVMDKGRRIYPIGSFANEFLYVATQEELIERLNIVKTDPNIRLDVLHAQRVAINWNAETFCESLVSTLEAL